MCEEVVFLIGNLGGGGVVGNGVVIDSLDVVGILYNKIFVYSEVVV